MNDWTNAEWADGPLVYAWIRENGLTRQIDNKGPMARRLSDWKRGYRASLPVLDQMMVLLGHHIFELPNEVWQCPQGPRDTRAHTTRRKRGPKRPK